MELRHLRYFTAVVQWKGYREASRHLYVAQPSISEAVSDLESELGIKLFSREGRVARLTREGQVFDEEAIKTLATRYPGAALRLEENVPSGQDIAFGRGEIDIGFMRPPSIDRSSSYESRLIFREPLVVVLSRGRKVTAKRIRIADVASERFVIFQRASSPEVFDTIVRLCNDNGFSPRLHNELNNMQSVLSTVEAD